MNWESVSWIIATLVGITILHSYLIIPRILKECRKEWEPALAQVLEERKALFDGMMRRIERLDDAVFHAGKTKRGP